jgi:hypothetical protein
LVLRDGGGVFGRTTPRIDFGFVMPVAFFAAVVKRTARTCPSAFANLKRKNGFFFHGRRI